MRTKKRNGPSSPSRPKKYTLRERDLPRTFKDREDAVADAAEGSLREDLVELGLPLAGSYDEELIAAKAAHKRADKLVSKLFRACAFYQRILQGDAVPVPPGFFEKLRDPMDPEWEEMACCGHFLLEHKSGGGCIIPQCACGQRGTLPTGLEPPLLMGQALQERMREARERHSLAKKLRREKKSRRESVDPE